MVLRELISPDITGNTQHYHKLFSLLIQRKHRHKDMFSCARHKEKVAYLTWNLCSDALVKKQNMC